MPSRPLAGQRPDYLGNWELGNGRARLRGGVLRLAAGERAAGERQPLPEFWAPENLSDHNPLPHQSSKSPPYTLPCPCVCHGCPRQAQPTTFSPKAQKGSACATSTSIYRSRCQALPVTTNQFLNFLLGHLKGNAGHSRQSELQVPCGAGRPWPVRTSSERSTTPVRDA